MPHLLLRRKSSIQSVSIAKQPSKESVIEFRWSISANPVELLQEKSLSNIHHIDLDSSHQKSFFSSSSSTARSSTTSRSSMSTQNSSSRLPNINRSNELSTSNRSSISSQKFSPQLSNVNETNEQSTSMDQNDSEQIKSLLLTYSELHRSSSPKKISRVRCSIDPLLNDRRSYRSAANTTVSFSSDSTSSSTKDTYIRLNTSQLRRLHVSEKYMKEAKTLYYNAACKVFVPRLAITLVS